MLEIIAKMPSGQGEERWINERKEDPLHGRPCMAGNDDDDDDDVGGADNNTQVVTGGLMHIHSYGLPWLQVANGKCASGTRFQARAMRLED
mmetsp:Transcript_25323/g.34780  ORF Transcript_25323/g.34780 Transcript_25323/m.34780 type:complete len:91 (-) Transcript_25323:172-444(-)